MCSIGITTCFLLWGHVDNGAWPRVIEATGGASVGLMLSCPSVLAIPVSVTPEVVAGYIGSGRFLHSLQSWWILLPSQILLRLIIRCAASHHLPALLVLRHSSINSLPPPASLSIAYLPQLIAKWVYALAWIWSIIWTEHSSGMKVLCSNAWSPLL